MIMTALSLVPILLGLKGGLSVAVVEMALQVPRKKLMKKGIVGVILAMALSYIVPLILKRFLKPRARRA